MVISAVKTIFKSVQRILGFCIVVLSIALMISQYFLITDKLPISLSSHDYAEGVSINQYSDALLVGQTVDKMYYVRMNYHLPDDVPQNAVKVFVDHRLVAVLTDTNKTVALSEGQILTLDGSQLKVPLPLNLYIGDGREEQKIKKIVLPGQLQDIEWLIN